MYRLIVARGSADSLGELIEAAEDRDIRIEHHDRQKLDSLSDGSNHQGVLLEASPFDYVDLDDVLAVAASRGEPPFMLLLDLIQDVQNVATLLRAADAVGVHGLIIQERRGASITPAVVNSSSGAVEHLAVAQVTNLVQAMLALKDAGVWLAGLDTGDDAVRYDTANLKGSIGLVVGSEGKGLRRLVRETCDFIIALPMKGQVESLNAATAGSIVLYAAWQARDFK